MADADAVNCKRRHGRRFVEAVWWGSSQASRLGEIARGWHADDAQSAGRWMMLTVIADKVIAWKCLVLARQNFGHLQCLDVVAVAVGALRSACQAAWAVSPLQHGVADEMVCAGEGSFWVSETLSYTHTHWLGRVSPGYTHSLTHSLTRETQANHAGNTMK